ncbi:hypothetical protein MRX96_028758 [Rhipicephalus microplus]
MTTTSWRQKMGGTGGEVAGAFPGSACGCRSRRLSLDFRLTAERRACCGEKELGLHQRVRGRCHGRDASNAMVCGRAGK